MNREGLFNFVPAALGIDPSSVSVGLCLMLGDGRVVNTWAVQAKGAPLRRLCTIHTEIRKLFDFIEDDTGIQRDLGGSELEVWIEDALIHRRPNAGKISAMLGEVRGAILAEAWRHRWVVHKMSLWSWKALLTDAERKMGKDAAYTRYWNESLYLQAQSPDEIDAYMIARRAVAGRRKT